MYNQSVIVGLKTAIFFTITNLKQSEKLTAYCKL